MTTGDRTRLALVVPGLTLGGGITAVARFIRDTALRDDRFDLTMVSLSVASDDPLSLRLASPRSWVGHPVVRADAWDTVPYVHVGAAGTEFEFQRYRPRRALSRVLADCDVVQVVCGSPAWANAVLGLGKPVAVHVATRARVERRQRDADPGSASAWWRKAMTEITDRMDDRALRRVDAIQAMNPWLLKYAQELNQGRDVETQYLPPGVNTTRFRPIDRHQPAPDSYILCVARLSDPRKKVGVLLDAYARLPEAVRRQTRLVMAGQSGPPELFWQRAAALGVRDRITFVDAPDEARLVQLYQGASAFALSSDEEGFGVVLLEAMACGVPVISTRSGGPEGIVTDGEDGYLVPLDDDAALSARLTHLLQDAACNLAMGRRARQTIEQRYDEHVAGDAFGDLWARLARKAGRT